ncbi:MAG: hypothetical protein GX275_14080 [Clostridiales bacterium]|nr:hypothetical protein [Clostridiales bacterium]
MEENVFINSGNKKIILLIVLGTMFIYYIIGYFLNTDILNAFTFRKNGISFSIIGLILLIITTIAICFIIDVFTKKKS